MSVSPPGEKKALEILENALEYGMDSDYYSIQLSAFEVISKMQVRNADINEKYSRLLFILGGSCERLAESESNVDYIFGAISAYEMMYNLAVESNDESGMNFSLLKKASIYAKMDEKQLKTMLLEDPTVASFAEANPNSQIFLQKRADGSIQLCSSSGQTLVLDKSTTTNQIAVSYFEKSLTSENNQSAHHPGAVYLIK